MYIVSLSLEQGLQRQMLKSVFTCSARLSALSSRFTKNRVAIPESCKRSAALVIACAWPDAPPTKKMATFLMRKPLRTLLKVLWATKLMALSSLRPLLVCSVCSPSMCCKRARFFIPSAKRISVVTSSLYSVRATRAPLGQLLSEMVMSLTRRRTVSRMALKVWRLFPWETSKAKASSVG